MRIFQLPLWSSLVLLVLGGCAEPRVPPGEERLFAEQRHAQASRQIEQLGGRVIEARRGPVVNLHRTSPDATREAMRIIPNLVHVDSLVLVPAQPMDLRLREMGELPSLRHLLIREAPLSARDIRYINNGLPQLRSLELIRTGATDAQIGSITVLGQLETVTLVEPQITDQTVRRLGEIGPLRRLRLVGTGATEQAVRRIVEQNTRLIVELNGQSFRGRDAPQ